MCDSGLFTQLGHKKQNLVQKPFKTISRVMEECNKYLTSNTSISQTPYIHKITGPMYGMGM